MAAKNKPNELHLTRTYDAPVKAVWEAWTDPAQTAQWWGPRGFTLTTHSKDLKPGGHWSYTMHGPDGTDYENTTKYFEVEKYSKLVYDHGGHEDRPALFRVTVLFTDLKGKTKMDMTMTLSTAQAAVEMKKFIKDAGGDATWDRLAEFLDKDATGKDNFVINRTFHATLDQMYDMWTNPKHIAQWLPLTGANMQFIRADIRPGGTSFFMMDGVHGKMYGRIEYLKMERPNLLVYAQQFCDENEKLSRHPLAPTWPETMLTTVRFVAEDDEHVRVSLKWEVYGAATAEELATFARERRGMTQGWTGSFDKLESILEK